MADPGLPKLAITFVYSNKNYDQYNYDY